MSENNNVVEFEGGSESVATAKQFVIYLAINAVLAVGFYYLLHDFKQTVAATIFTALVIGTLMFWRFRVGIAFIGIVILLLTQTIDLEHTISFMSVDVIIFLVGMMVVVGILRRSGFFRWLLAQGLTLARFRPNLLLTMILLMSAIMAAMVDEVTSILFVIALVLDFCDFFQVNPVKYVIAVVLATNIGSSWTVLGNPIGILIALRSGLTFEDFIKTAAPVGILSLLVMIVIIMIWQRGDLRQLRERLGTVTLDERKLFLKDLTSVPDKHLFKGSSIIFIAVVILLALHYRLELALGMQHNTLLVAISIAGAGVVMLWQRGLARDLLTKDVDWWTLIFFMFLFAKAGTLQYVGITDKVGAALFSLVGGTNMLLLVFLVLWISGFVSAALDNVLVVATFIPVLQYMGNQTDVTVLWWALLFGACYGGNMTMVGSTANIVALGVLENRKSYHMTFKKWIYIGLIGSVVPMAAATVYLLLVY